MLDSDDVLCRNDFLSLSPLTHPTLASHRFIYCSPRHRNSRVESPCPVPGPSSGSWAGICQSSRAFPRTHPWGVSEQGFAFPRSPVRAPPVLLPEPGSALESCSHTAPGPGNGTRDVPVPGCAAHSLPRRKTAPWKACSPALACSRNVGVLKGLPSRAGGTEGVKRRRMVL